MHVRARPVVHHSVCKHEIYISLVLQGIADDAVLDLRLYCFKINGPLHDVVVVGGLGDFDRVVEYVTVAVLGYLRVDHSDHRLKTLQRDLFFRPTRGATA